MNGRSIHFYSEISRVKRAKSELSMVLKRKLSRSVTDWESIELNQTEFKLDAEKNNNQL